MWVSSTAGGTRNGGLAGASARLNLVLGMDGQFYGDFDGRGLRTFPLSVARNAKTKARLCTGAALLRPMSTRLFQYCPKRLASRYFALGRFRYFSYSALCLLSVDVSCPLIKR